jgi:hypothetical protein
MHRVCGGAMWHASDVPKYADRGDVAQANTCCLPLLVIEIYYTEYTQIGLFRGSRNSLHDYYCNFACIIF